MRYEGHLSRQLYQAKHELEVLQKQRRGEATPLARLDVQGLTIMEPGEAILPAAKLIAILRERPLAGAPDPCSRSSPGPLRPHFVIARERSLRTKASHLPRPEAAGPNSGASGFS